jgi:hypothetical protein
MRRAPGIACVNVLPLDAQPSSRRQCELGGARTYYAVNWHDAGKIVAEACAKNGWFDVCTLREPYRMEGKKTMGLEIAEQLGWRLPDAVVYPMGGGLGAIAIWKAFEELPRARLGERPMPKLVVTQFAGCAPVVKAFDEGKTRVEPWGTLDVPPGGLKSPNPPAGAAVLAILRKHGGGGDRRHDGRSAARSRRDRRAGRALRVPRERDDDRRPAPSPRARRARTGPIASSPCAPARGSSRYRRFPLVRSAASRPLLISFKCACATGSPRLPARDDSFFVIARSAAAAPDQRSAIRGTKQSRGAR